MSFRPYFAVATLFGALIAAAAADQPASTLPPTKVSFKKADATLAEVAAGLARVSGLTIEVDPQVAHEKCEVVFADTPFWSALEQAASASGAKLVVLDGGRKVLFAPRGASKEVSSASGAFRVATKLVVGRALLDYGVTFHEVHLDVNWEPRYPVFRIDANPKITMARDDKGNILLTDSNTTRQHPLAALAEMKVKLTGLPREAKKIAVLAGEFRVTAAEKMLTFKFADLTSKTPIAKTEDRVAVVLKPLTYDDTTKTWDVDLEMTYPEPHPIFESFEEHKWLRDHRLQMLSPMGKPFAPENEDVVASGRKVTATYRFKGAVDPKGKGWSLVYEVPGPLIELTVPFELKNIPIP